MKLKSVLGAVLLAATTLTSLAQQPNQDALINIQVAQNIAAVNYQPANSTRIGFAGTALLPQAKGDAKVTSRNGIVEIQAKFEGLSAPQNFGAENLVYVLWAVSPEGRSINLGQLAVKGQKSKIDVTTKLQTFGLMVTAEPYFAVSFPSQNVVAANAVLNKTRGTVSEVKVSTELLQRGNYSDATFTGYVLDRKVPLDLYQARNAVRIATLEGAQTYAPEALAKASGALIQAETYHAQKKTRGSVPAVARQAVQTAEDARSISATRELQAKIRAEQLASQRARQTALQAQQEALAQAAREAEQRVAAEQQKAAADLAATQAAKERAASETAARKARTQARDAKVLAMQAIAEKEALREQLLTQFNRILPTTDTPRGLVVNAGDVLFDTGKADLRPEAKVALARLSGILANYPSLRLSIEGHTDNTGSAAFNQKLSEKRAEAVQAFVISQQLAPESISSVGLGESKPAADNSTVEGRQSNRRVEIVISGDVIGTAI